MNNKPHRPITRKMLIRDMKKRYEFMLLNDLTYGKYKDEFEVLEEFFNTWDNENDEPADLENTNNERTEQ